MTAEWLGGDLHVVDEDGDDLMLTSTPSTRFVVVVTAHSCRDDEQVQVGLTFDDGLALLQALADALKVDRYVPGGGA